MTATTLPKFILSVWPYLLPEQSSNCDSVIVIITEGATSGRRISGDYIVTMDMTATDPDSGREIKLPLDDGFNPEMFPATVNPEQFPMTVNPEMFPATVNPEQYPLTVGDYIVDEISFPVDEGPAWWSQIEEWTPEAIKKLQEKYKTDKVDQHR